MPEAVEDVPFAEPSAAEPSEAPFDVAVVADEEVEPAVEEPCFVLVPDSWASASAMSPAVACWSLESDVMTSTSSRFSGFAKSLT